MIEINVKNLKSVTTKITIDENASLESHIDLIKEASGLSEFPYIKIIYTGQVLDLSRTFTSYGISAGDAIIAMKSNPPKQVVTSAPAPAPVAQSSVSTTVSTVPAPVSASASAPAPASVADPIWTTPPASDTTATYSVEQAHVILPMVFSYIMQNPNLRLLMMTNPNILNEIMVTHNFRNIVRQLLAQSNGLLNSIRNGTPANIYIGVENPSGEQVPVNTTGAGVGAAQPQLSMEQLTQAMNMLGMDPSMMGFDDDYDDEDHTGHDHDHAAHDHMHVHDHAHGTTATATSGLTTQDQQNIAQLMEITGAQFPVAKQAYESSGKNMEIAGSLLMQIMFS